MIFKSNRTILRAAMAINVRSYWVMMKPGIMCMILVTATLGFFLARIDPVDWVEFVLFLLGTGLSCAGAGVLNNYLERDADAKMKRTMKRALPAGEIQPNDALALGIILVIVGTLLLIWQVNVLTAFLSLSTTFLYVLVYTPLKRVTWLNTLVGAIPGAIPPLGGWAAATGTLSYEAWILFLILFAWQHPHFYAIAWMYKEDYEKGGFRMLPFYDPSGERTFRQIIWFSLLLLFVSLLPSFVGMSGTIYLICSFLSGVALLGVGVALAESGTVADARNLLKASILYLPCLLIFIIIDRFFFI